MSSDRFISDTPIARPLSARYHPVMSADRPVEKLTAALEQMSSEDRSEVIAWLLTRLPPRTLSALPSPATDLGSHQVRESQLSLLRQSRVSVGELSDDLQLVTIRLPVDLHVRLKDWCQAHNFSMATVVRGLVDRFLDEQGGTTDTASA